MRSLRFPFRCCAAVLFSLALHAEPVTALYLRGYAVIPTPRQVRLQPGDITLDEGWRLDAPSHRATTTLLAGLGLKLQGQGPSLRLRVQPGAVSTGAAPEIDRQAYRLRIDDTGIEITGNGDPGLFYGVQTLLQLAQDRRAPKGTIEDWPSMQLRFLHWDTKHHQDRVETLKRYLDWSARFKINAIGFELEDKFAYPSHPDIGAPGAFTPAQMQEIVDYGLERYIQVIPVIQAPAHFAYVLKHPRYAHLKADGNNYQSAMCDPRTYELIFSMFDDAIRTTRGVDYLFASTDEVYYAGIDCATPYNDQNRSLHWVDYVKKARDFVAARGRKMLVWAEYPLLAEHVKLLPPDIIDGVIGEPEYVETENRLGIRQLAYTSMQGSEFLFPNHLALDSTRGHLRGAAETISQGRVWQGKPIGAFGAAWDDSGLHNETFWLGWSTVAQYAWTPGVPSVEQHAAEFMRIYYGPRSVGMIEIYRDMQRQARAWESSWERVRSRVRASGYGNSYGKGIGTDRRDYTLPAPALPQGPDLAFSGSKYKDRAAGARSLALDNDRLVHALLDNFARVDRNAYNLEVFLALARFMGHHWRLIEGLAAAERSLESASKSKPEQAVGHMVSAYRTVDRLCREGLATFQELTAVYEKSRFPKGQSVDGRRFVHVLDDTKDHWADRTPDLGFMYAQEKSIGLDQWRKDLYKIVQEYAARHRVPVKGLGEARLEE
ncbi:MAG: beta-N-acetylhexosaminidase [Acidobacteria bacterium]|nr:beta-N-acetylhexosaminidase [Acidobacteriota bacterium]